MIEILLDAGADVQHSDDISGTPLHGAARRNHATCCRLLLNRGARVDASDGVGNRPLHLAAAEGAVSALEVLLLSLLCTVLESFCPPEYPSTERPIDIIRPVLTYTTVITCVSDSFLCTLGMGYLSRQFSVIQTLAPGCVCRILRLSISLLPC